MGIRNSTINHMVPSIILTGLNRGLEQDASSATLVVDGVLLRELIELEANLVTIHTTPGEELALVGACQRVVLAAVDVCDGLLLEVGKLGGLQDNGFVLASVGLDANLAKVI